MRRSTRSPRFNLPSRAYFARKLDEHLDSTGATLRELGDALGVGGNNLSLWRWGDQKIPLDRIAGMALAIPTIDPDELTVLRLAEEEPAVVATLERALPSERALRLARWFDQVESAYGIVLDVPMDPRGRGAAELGMILSCAVEREHDYPVEPYDPAIQAQRRATATRFLARVASGSP